MKITFKVVDHKKQRYNTVGDWYYTNSGDMIITSSRMSDSRYETLVHLHEFIEARLCDEAGVQQEDVDAFDIEFEKNRVEGDTSEPGDDLRAPYYKQHQFATVVERQMAGQLGVNWEEYEKEVNSL